MALHVSLLANSLESDIERRVDVELKLIERSPKISVDGSLRRRRLTFLDHKKKWRGERLLCVW